MARVKSDCGGERTTRKDTKTFVDDADDDFLKINIHLIFSALFHVV